LTAKQLAITQFKATFLRNVTLVSHQKRLGKNLRFEKKKTYFTSEFITLPQGLRSPHRELIGINSTELELIVQNWTKRITKLIWGIFLLLVILFLYITYLNGNSFAVAPYQTREQTICMHGYLHQLTRQKSVFLRF